MKSKVIIIAGSVLLAMSSCSVVQQTATTLQSEASVRNFTVADLDVSPERIHYTMEPTKAEQRGGLDNVKRAAESKALKENGNSDVLVDPEFVIEQKKNFFGTKVSKITVSGHPAKYKNYRSLEDTVWSNPAFRGLPSVVVRKGADRGENRFMQALATSAPGQIYDEPAARRERRNPTGYNRIMVTYSPVYTNMSIGGIASEESKTHNAAGISYVHGFRLSSRIPLYLETGAGWRYGPESNHLELMRINIPAVVTYRFTLGQGNIKISPYTGLNFAINPINESRHLIYYEDRKSGDESFFQLGWQIGGNFTFKRFNIQVGYTFDFMRLYQQDESNKFVSEWVSSYYGGYGGYVTRVVPVPEYKITSGTLTVGVGFEF